MIVVEPMPDLGEVNLSHKPGAVAYLLTSLSAVDAWNLGVQLQNAARDAFKNPLPDSHEATHRR